MRVNVKAVAVGGAVAFLAASLATAQDFEWKGSLKPGQALEIKGINGGIHAKGGPGALVTAVKKARKSDPASVQIKAVEHAGGVTVCALYPAAPGSPSNECAPGEGGRMTSKDKDNDVQVEFTVQVPDGVRFVGRTVNGGIDGEALPAGAEAKTVNGGIRLSAAAAARAETVNGTIDLTLGNDTGADPLTMKTVNGSIRASFKNASGSTPLTLKTVNGTIKVELPADAKATVDAKTVNGGIQTDLPLTVQGTISKRRLQGTLGGGGRRIELETVNGGVELRKTP
jgi:hypothetical protein